MFNLLILLIFTMAHPLLLDNLNKYKRRGAKCVNRKFFLGEGYPHCTGEAGDAAV
jgi:hypothetical protein